MRGLTKSKGDIREFRIYSYVPADVGEWLTKLSKEHDLKISSVVYACIQACYTKDKFDPRKTLNKCLKK